MPQSLQRKAEERLRTKGFNRITGFWGKTLGSQWQGFLDSNGRKNYMDIWKKCSRSGEIVTIEKEVAEFLQKHCLEKKISVSDLEEKIYSSKTSEIDAIFNSILDGIENGNLSDLKYFDDLFRKKLLSHVPQKALGGLSPIKYAIFLKNMRDS